MKRTNHASAFAAKYANNLYWASNGTITKAEAFKAAYAYYNANKATILAEIAATQPAPQPKPATEPKKRANLELLQFVMTEAAKLRKQIIGGVSLSVALKIAYARYHTTARPNKHAVTIQYVKIDGEIRTANAEKICELKERDAKNGLILYMENIPGEDEPKVRTFKAENLLCIKPAQPRREKAQA